MPLKPDTTATVVLGKVVFTQTHGVSFKTEGGDTVKLPKHMIKFFKDHGLVA